LLGYEKVIHHCPEYLQLDQLTGRHDLKVYDNVDAVFDAPASFFWYDLMQLYPECKVILTVRNRENWWRSILAHTVKIWNGGHHDHIPYTNRLHALLFGTVEPHAYLWKRALQQHSRRVRGGVPPERLLVLDVTRSCHDAELWLKLSQFLNCEMPSAVFPWANRLATKT